MRLAQLFSQDRDYVVAYRQGEAISFQRFHADVAATAANLSGCRRAALFCQDTYAFAVGFFGLLHAGAEVILPANGQPGTLEALSGKYDRLLGDELLDQPSSDRLLTPLEPEQSQITFFTSGSTGEPKRVAKSLGMLDREVATYLTMWTPGPVLATVTHQHLYGLTFRLLWPLVTGKPFSAETHEVWETLLPALTQGAVVISSPAHLSRLTGIAPVPRERRPSLVFSAGAPLPAKAAAETASILGCLPTEIFGSTETGAFATRRQESGDEPWRLLPDNQIRTDLDGRLTLRSPYVKDWLQTADLVQPWPGGFRYLGRIDRVAKIEGKRIALTEVEAALTKLPWIKEAAITLLPGEPPRLAAVVVPSPEGRLRLAELGSFRFSRLIRHDLAHTQEPAGMPRQWRFVESLPSYPLGKRRDADVAALFTEGP